MYRGVYICVLFVWGILFVCFFVQVFVFLFVCLFPLSCLECIENYCRLKKKA